MRVDLRSDDISWKSIQYKMVSENDLLYYI